MGLVPKDKGKKTRLIFHLSYPKSGDSVNSGIPGDLCSVSYPDFMEAVKICIRAGKACYCGKSDMSMAFRNIPMDRKSWRYLILKAKHTRTGVILFCGQMSPFWSFNQLCYFPGFFRLSGISGDSQNT